MADDSTLMAYLVPRLTRQVENAATDALGYILNKSPEAMQALNNLLQQGDFGIEPIARVETQVTYEDRSRPDMAGYDKNNVKRLLVEAKFWAALSEDQASGYSLQFDQPGRALLLFVAPETRIPTLWASITRQMEKQSRLEVIGSPPGLKRAEVIGTELHLMLVSWVRLLDSIAALAGDNAVGNDIQQLRGLTQKQDTQAFLPVHSEELSPYLGRRIVWYSQLADHVVGSRGVPEGWMDIHRRQATSQRYGYGRYFRFTGVEGDLWFGVNHERWATGGDTPLWLRVADETQVNFDEIGKELNVRIEDRWIPIHLKLGVEYLEVLDDVVSQLKAIAKIVGARLISE